MLAERGLLTTAGRPRTASTSTRRRSTLLAGTGSRVVHCPRSNALPRLRDRAAARACARRRHASASAPTARPRRRRSTCSTRCGRPSRRPARASARPDALSRRGGARARHARLGAGARARRGDRSLVPGKRADLTVVSLAGSPYFPVEDPAAAVVFGGSPDRVLLDPRRWRRSVREGRSGLARADRRRVRARARMLAGGHGTGAATSVAHGGHPLLPAHPRTTRSGSSSSSRSSFAVELRRSSASAPASAALRTPPPGTAATGGGPSDDDARDEIAGAPEQSRRRYRDLATALQKNGKSDEAIEPLAKLRRAEAEATSTRCASSRGSTSARRTRSARRRSRRRSRSRRTSRARPSSRRRRRRSRRRSEPTRSPRRSRRRTTRRSTPPSRR